MYRSAAINISAITEILDVAGVQLHVLQLRPLSDSNGGAKLKLSCADKIFKSARNYGLLEDAF